MFLTKYLRIGGVEYNTRLAARETLPTAYAPATLARSRSTGIDAADPARFTVDVTVPTSTRPNLITNPSFEDGTTGWSVTGGTLSTTASYPQMVGRVGTYIAQCVAAASTTNLYPWQDVPDVRPENGGWLGCRLWYAHDQTTGLRARLVVYFYDAAGTLIGSPTTPWATGGGFYVGRYVTLTASIPAGTVRARVHLSMTRTDGTALPSGARLWLDQVNAAQADTQADAEAAVGWFHEGDGLPQLGDAVAVSVVGRESDANTTFVGQIESLSRRRKVLRNADGSTFTADVYVVAATDLFGVLSRRTVGSEPWPEEQVPDRWNRIRALVPDIPMVERDDYSGRDFVVPRDVDNTSALALLRDTVAMQDEELYITSEGQIGFLPRNQTITAPDLWDPTTGTIVRGGAFATIHLPATAFEDPGDTVDYDLVVNVARVTGNRHDPDNPGDYVDRIATFTNAESRTRHGESTWSVSGDGLADGVNVPDVDAMPAARRARRLVDTAGTPMWRLAGSVAAVPHRVTDDDATSWVTDLMETASTTPIIMLDGAPEGRDVWRVTGLQATWGGTDVEALALDVEPYEMAGPLGLTFVAANTSPPLTFAQSAPMTFRQARTVDAIGFF